MTRFVLTVGGAEHTGCLQPPVWRLCRTTGAPPLTVDRRHASPYHPAAIDETPLPESHMPSPMLPRERCEFSAIVDRPPLKLPGDARIVVWTIVNYEVWDIGRPMPRQVLPAPTGVPLLPDVPHWSWHEYGMRVGAWRFFELYERLGIRPTLSINARICEDYTRVAEEARRLGWEFMGHAYDQMPIHKHEDQRGMINRSMDMIEKFTGKRPVGWLGPGLTQTLDTPELLVEAGVKYIGDWVYDDEPTDDPHRQRLAGDAALHGRDQRHYDDDRAASRERIICCRRAIDQFDRLYAEGRAPRQGDGDRDSSLYQRPAAPDQISRSDLRPRAPLRRRAALERRADSATGIRVRSVTGAPAGRGAP